MDASDVSASIAQVDRMLDRVVKVIGHERPDKPLRPDVSYPRRMVVAKPTSRSHAVASGQLVGNEMRRSNGYTARPRADGCDDPTGMWAAFEADFDDMVAGMH